MRLFHGRRAFFAGFLLGSVLFGLSCASIGPREVNFERFRDELDLVFTRMGKMEVAFCYNVLSESSVRVREVALAPQARNDSTSIGFYNCEHYDGVIHNHPRELGGEFANDLIYRHHCYLSATDTAGLRKAYAPRRFVSAWCGPDFPITTFEKRR